MTRTLETNRILEGDALSVLKLLPEACAQMCVTSPPYYGLRSYDIPPLIWDGDSGCIHEWESESLPKKRGRQHLKEFGERLGCGGGSKHSQDASQFNGKEPRLSTFCLKCSAWRGYLGLEPTPALYVKHLIMIFCEVRRVLRQDGTLWLNLGDSYSDGTMGRKDSYRRIDQRARSKKMQGQPIKDRGAGSLGSKQLLGIPWRVALALQDDGWILRTEIIWHKPTAIPDGAEDRPSRNHEYIFLFTKRQRYYYDADAIREPVKPKTLTTYGTQLHPLANDALLSVKSANWHDSQAVRKPRLSEEGELVGANKRTVWTIASQPFLEAHFATFPPKLIEPAILAGSSARACELCGAPWKPVTGIGWKSTCKCVSAGQGKCVILDPFMGAGTTAKVALQHNRDFLGIELNPEYIQIALRRIATVQPDLWDFTAGEGA